LVIFAVMSTGALDSSAVLHVSEWAIRSVSHIAATRADFADVEKAGLMQKNTKPMEFSTHKAMLNRLTAQVNKLEAVSVRVPRKKKELRTRLAADEAEDDPGEMFLARMKPKMSKLSELCDRIGNDDNDVSEQFEDFETAMEELSKLISYASTCAKPIDQGALRLACRKLIAAADEAVEYKEDVNARDPYKNHYESMAEAAASLGWVVSPAPVKHMTDYKRIVSIYTENILASYIELGCDEVHSEYSEALNTVVAELYDYVEQEHPAGLKWNYAKGSTPLGYKAARTLTMPNAHVLADFVELMDIQLEAYVYASEFLGGKIAEQARKLVDVFEQEYEMLQAAQRKPRPKGLAEMKMLFTPTMHEIAAVMSVSDAAANDDRLSLHLRTVAEAVGVLTWPVVLDITPLNYVVDIQSGLRTYFERFRLQYKPPKGAAAHPTAAFHLKWAHALRDLVVGVKTYVHVHHEHEMEFGTGHEKTEVRAALQKKEIKAALDQLKAANAKKRKKSWTAGATKGPLHGKIKPATHPPDGTNHGRSSSSGTSGGASKTSKGGRTTARR